MQIDQLKQLRQWGSITPGHPERQMADGIEVTTGTHLCDNVIHCNDSCCRRPLLRVQPTSRYACLPAINLRSLIHHTPCCGAGPLGQGIANAVGLAAAEAHLGAVFNKSDAPKMFDNYTCALITLRLSSPPRSMS